MHGCHLVCVVSMRKPLLKWACLFLLLVSAGGAPALAQSAAAPSRAAEGYSAVDKGDYAAALRVWRPLAEGGDAESQFLMGWLYQYGLGVQIDYVEALRWYQRAAKQNYAQAQSNIGVMYDVGLGQPQDQREAANWYRQAAEQGNAAAQFNLGWLYQNGTGVPQDYEMSKKLYLQSASQGNGPAQYNLGLLYDEGKGVPKDIVLAYMWFNVAGARLGGDGLRRAVQSRDDAAARMTPDQIRQAQERAQSCLTSGFKAC